MNKFFFLLSVSFILCCSGLNNPFDTRSPNHVSDTSLVRLMQNYDSTFIDTSFVFDTVFVVDTSFIDSIRIIQQIHIDTTFVLDTVFDTIRYNDTSFYVDSSFVYDTVTYIDTIRIDTITHYDTISRIDTIRFLDTTFFRDTLQDTTRYYDTISYLDTLFFFDTTHSFDTVHFLDTLFHYDTLVFRDTVIDTVYYYNSQPFLYLIDLSDSSVFSTFEYDSSYNLSIVAAGIDPSIIQSYSFMPEGGTFWNSVVPPWSRSYSTTSPVIYSLRVVTDSGSFANSYTVRCSPSSIIRGSKPSFQSIQFNTLQGFFQKFTGYAPVCTLWTDSSEYSLFSEKIGLLVMGILFDLTGCNEYDFHISSTGSYDISSSALYDQVPWGELYYEYSDIPIGTNIVTANCRCVVPDTSQWSGWSTFVLIVRDGR